MVVSCRHGETKMNLRHVKELVDRLQDESLVVDTILEVKAECQDPVREIGSRDELVRSTGQLRYHVPQMQAQFICSVPHQQGYGSNDILVQKIKLERTII